MLSKMQRLAAGIGNHSMAAKEERSGGMACGVKSKGMWRKLAALLA